MKTSRTSQTAPKGARRGRASIPTGIANGLKLSWHPTKSQSCERSHEHRHNHRQCATGQRLPEGAVARASPRHSLLAGRWRTMRNRDRGDSRIAAAISVATPSPAARRKLRPDAPQRQEHLLLARATRGARRNRCSSRRILQATRVRFGFVAADRLGGRSVSAIWSEPRRDRLLKPQ